MFIRTHTKNVTTYNALGFIEGAIEPGILPKIICNIELSFAQYIRN